MGEMTKALYFHLTKCVLLLTATETILAACPPHRKCDDSSSSEETDDNDFIHIYTLAPPSSRFTRGDWQKEQYSSNAGVWIVVVGVIAAVVLIVACCFGFFFLSRRRRIKQRVLLERQRRFLQAAGAVQSPSAPPIASFENGQNRSSVESRRSEGPPEYAAVVQDRPDGCTVEIHPPVHEEKKAETPPPAYITVAPFQ